jgi:hypothetical protein
MTLTADDRVTEALRSMGPKPDMDANRGEKKRWSELLSEKLALAFADELRARGMDGARPAEPGMYDRSGAERRMAGGIGAKKVDVTWATEESGLLVAISVKTISFADKRTNNYQKNLINRRGDLLIEAVTLHKRFPYAVIFGVLAFPEEAGHDDTDRRDSTFSNAHYSFKLFTGRNDIEGNEEQYEGLFIALHNSNQFAPSMQFFEAGDPENPLTASEVFDRLVSFVAARNADLYSYKSGKIVKR